MPELTPEMKARLAEQFMQAIPHSRALSMRLDHLGRAVAEASMPWDERLIGDPRTGVVHGGAVSSLLDTCCGAAIMSHPAGPLGTATIDLRIDYMRAATPGQRLRARAECYHVTRSVAFVRATAFDDDRDNPVASAAGTFTLEWGSRGWREQVASGQVAPGLGVGDADGAADEAGT